MITIPYLCCHLLDSFSLLTLGLQFLRLHVRPKSPQLPVFLPFPFYIVLFVFKIL